MRIDSLSFSLENMGKRGRRKIKISKPKKTADSKSRNTNYRNYDQKDIEKAYKDTLDNKMSVRAASVKHGIPASTLRDRVHGRIKISTTQSGPPPFMPNEDEKTFVKHMMMLKTMGYRYRQVDIANAAADYGHYYGKRDISEGPMSRGWIKKFVDRQKKKVTYQEYHFRAKCPFPPPNMQKKYYDELEAIMKTHNLMEKPHLIYNLSETTLDADPDGDHDPEGTLFSCVNALGVKLPPFFIFNGKKPNAKLTRGGPDGLGAVMSETGGPNSRIMQHYLKDHFLKNLEAEEEDENTHVLLLYDGHKSRILFPVIKWALEHKIILFVIPPHCSITVEPCQISTFNAMERWFQKECSSFSKKHDEKAIDRYNICRIASKGHEKVFIPSTIMTSFHESGVYPFKAKVFQKAPEPLPNQSVHQIRRRRRPHAPIARKAYHKARAAGRPPPSKRRKLQYETSESEDMTDLSSEEEEEGEGQLYYSMANQDHSYGTNSSTFEDGIISDSEISHVIEEAIVQTTEGDKTWTIPLASNDQESAALAAETIVVKSEAFPVDEMSPEVVISELAQDIYVHTGNENSNFDNAVVKTEYVDAATETVATDEVTVKSEIALETESATSSTAEEATEVVSKMSGEIHSISDINDYVKNSGITSTQFLLIRPKSEPGGQQKSGRLIPLASEGSSDGKDLVIKVIELGQETFDKVIAGGEVIIKES